MKRLFPNSSVWSHGYYHRRRHQKYQRRFIVEDDDFMFNSYNSSSVKYPPSSWKLLRSSETTLGSLLVYLFSGWTVNHFNSTMDNTTQIVCYYHYTSKSGQQYNPYYCTAVNWYCFITSYRRSWQQFKMQYSHLGSWHQWHSWLPRVWNARGGAAREEECHFSFLLQWNKPFDFIFFY